MISSERSRVVPPVASSVSARPSRWNAPVSAVVNAVRERSGEERWRAAAGEGAAAPRARGADGGAYDRKERRGAGDIRRTGCDHTAQAERGSGT